MSMGVVVAGAMLVGPAAAATASLTVIDQKASGDQITVGDVSMPKDGFLVIYPTDAEGNFIDKAIGHTALKAGDHRSVKVTLNGTQKPGEKLVAILHEDTGNKGTYEYGMAGKSNVDMPLKDKGKVVEESFTLK
jgi:hypothetical protein